MLGFSPLGDTPLGGLFLEYGAVPPLLLTADIELDGGDDYYYPAWMRVMGRANSGLDALAAAERYITFYLNTPDPGTKGYSNPGIITDSTPIGSICQDKDGNVFYSITLGGVTYNFLTDGNLSELFPLVGDGQYYPVGLA